MTIRWYLYIAICDQTRIKSLKHETTHELMLTEINYIRSETRIVFKVSKVEKIQYHHLQQSSIRIISSIWGDILDSTFFNIFSLVRLCVCFCPYMEYWYTPCHWHLKHSYAWSYMILILLKVEDCPCLRISNLH